MAFLGFKGKYNHTLDPKFRMFIPSKYREKLGQNFTICRGEAPNQCLYLYPNETWEEICEELNTMYGSEEAYWNRRMTCMSAEDVTMDSQGRITISQEMREFAGLTSEVVLIGNLKHMEVWSPEVWAKTLETAMSRGVASTAKINY